MTEVQDLVAAVYRADWTRLSLSARITRQRDSAADRELHRRAMDELARALGPVPRPWRPPDADRAARPDWPESEQHILVAPGGRYRTGAGDPATVCDGETRWEISGGVARRYPAESRPTALRGLATPQWLLACYDLEIIGRTQYAHRTVHRVTAVPRALVCETGHRKYHLLERIDVLVDAELGIILRSEQILGSQTLALAEMHDLIIDPPQAADPAQFRPPPGMPVADHPGLGTFEPRGLGWQAAITAADIAGAAMGFAVRHAPLRLRTREAGDDEPDMPQDAFAFAAGTAPPEPLSDELVNLLHRTGLPAQDFGADLHHWQQPETLVRAAQDLRTAMPQPIAGVFGPDAAWDAAEERGREVGSLHRTGRLRVSMPGRYRLDQETGRWQHPYQAIACDGEHTRKLYHDRVATGPASPLDSELAALADPAWLLHRWTLSLAGEVSVGGRRGYRIVARARRPSAESWAGLPFTPVEVIVDAELGILLRQTSYHGDRPATRSELRNLTRPTRPEDFRIEAGPGLREVVDTGGPLADRDLPTPVKAVGTAAVLAAGGAVAGAVAVTGWLQKRRARS